jgi:hypothetical protein
VEVEASAQAGIVVVEAVEAVAVEAVAVLEGPAGIC